MVQLLQGGKERTAIIMLPVDDLAKVTHNGSPVSTDKKENLVLAVDDNGKRSTGFQIGSGNYTFEYTE
jgi:hypothetical protein